MSRLKNMLVGLFLLFSTGLSTAREADVRQSKEVVATVNGNSITLSNLITLSNSISESQGQSISPVLLRLQSLTYAIDLAILLTHVQGNGSDSASNSYYNTKGQIQKIKKDLINQVKIKPDQVVNEFNHVKEKHKRLGYEYRASHILLGSEQDAQLVLEKLKQGAAFSTLHANFSVDSHSAMPGGDLGWFYPSVMVPEFSRAVTQMIVGSISTEPVKTQFGWHVINLHERRVPVFDAALAKQSIVYKLKSEQVNNSVY